MKEFGEILYLNGDEPAHEIKKSITEFVERHKESDISELVYYFSGHGERFGDDFFYLPSDFEKGKRERTGLRNSEIDDFAKTLAPSLFVKIVDACFSGTQYVKSESGTEAYLKSSARKYGLNDIYFLFSSRSDEPSYAGDGFSKFTESMLLAILDRSGEVRYRDIMDYIADDFSGSSDSKPIFVTQSGNIEKFGIIKESTHKIIRMAFGLDEESNDKQSKATGSGEVNASGEAEMPESIFDKIIAVSAASCFNEERLRQFISEFTSGISVWGGEFEKLYNIKATKISDLGTIPNAMKIGAWLESKQDSGYFARPTYRTEVYEVEEYKALPKKPSRDRRGVMGDFDAFARLSALQSLYGQDETEYKLEKVSKQRRILDGFEYTDREVDGVLNITFLPKVEVIDAVAIYIVPIYSNKEMIINFSNELLHRKNWSEFSRPRCSDWKLIKVNVSHKNTEASAVNHVRKNIEGWLLESLNKIVSK